MTGRTVTIIAAAIAALGGLLSPAFGDDEARFCQAMNSQMKMVAATSRALLDQAIAALPDDIEKQVVDAGLLSLQDPSFRHQLVHTETTQQTPTVNNSLDDYLTATADLLIPLKEYADEADIAAGTFDRCSRQ